MAIKYLHGIPSGIVSQADKELERLGKPTKDVGDVPILFYLLQDVGFWHDPN